LTVVTIPKSTTEIIFNPDSSIQRTTFCGCTALTSITVHPDNPVYASDDGILYDKDKTKLIFCPRGKQGDYIIPDSVIEIGEASFLGCTGLTSIVIPDSVTVIGNYAFCYCTGLTSIFIPATVIDIRSWVFEDCTAHITVHPDNPVYKNVNGKIRRKRKKNIPQKDKLIRSDNIR